MAKIIIKGTTSQIIEETDANHILALDKHLSFYVQGAEHTAAFRGFFNKDGDFVKWDGFKKLLTPTLQFPTGLVERVKDFYTDANKNIEIIDKRPAKSIATPKNIENNLKKIGKIPYPYQTKILDIVDKYDRGIIKVATGGGKCNDKNSLHITEYGILDYIELLNHNSLSNSYIKVATPLTTSKTDLSSHIYYNGFAVSKRIINSYGYELTATPEHKIKIINEEGNLIWKKFADIKVNDYTVICPGTNLFGKDNLDLDTAYWYGLLLGDGSFVNKNKITLTNMDQHILNFAKNYLHSNNIKFSIINKGKAQDICINNVKYRKQLFDYGFHFDKSINKSLPVNIRKLQKLPLAMVIRGLYETDGWIGKEKNKPTINIALSNKQFIDQLHVILLNFGIVASRRVKKTTHCDSHILTIYKSFISKFEKEIGFDPNGRKFIELNDEIAKYSCNSNSNKSIVPNQKNNLKEIIKPFLYKRDFWATCPIKRNTIKSWIYNRNPDKNNLLTFLLWIKQSSNSKLIDDMISLCSEELYYLPIVQMQEVLADTYDFVVPETHSFVSQGFINHNTMIASLTVAKFGKKTIIYVIGKDLLYQFYDFFCQCFDEEIGIIGDGKCIIRDINIASIWTIGQAIGLDKKSILLESDNDEQEVSKNKYSEILDMMKQAKVHIIDECHMSACETIQQIFKRAQPEHIYGLSGSPWRDDGADLLIESILGKYIVNISASELIKNNFLAQPLIRFRVVPPYHYQLEKSYQSVYKKYVVENDIRNGLVLEATKGLVEKGYQTLVLFNSIKHGKILYDTFKQHMKCAILDGSNDKDEREQVKKDLMNHNIDCVLASKIFDIGVDIPSLSGLVIACGGKSTVKALQRVGRVIRKYPSKKYAVIIDFIDQAPFLDNHSKIRYKIYSSEDGFDVKIPSSVKWKKGKMT